MNNTRQFFVSGRVQGVGFREATRKRADELGMAGWVRNLADGRVEVQASAGDDTLDTLERWLHDGPAPARVEHVESHAVEGTQSLPRPFAVR
ncbi:acylphosphatase [Salinisphaera sp. C84B14]|jgi:acylphosphatase|uniref:acylphosphatase n=1 Tax=Salinisphaera sp. C84B14 TaxID=1304155 RepID=UPI0032B2DBC9